MSTQMVYIPRELQLADKQPLKHVCTKAFLFLSQFKFIKIDKRNPILKLRPALRNALVWRRKVHKLFDMLKCPRWNVLLQETEFKNDQFVVLRDCYLPFDWIN